MSDAKRSLSRRGMGELVEGVGVDVPPRLGDLLIVRYMDSLLSGDVGIGEEGAIQAAVELFSRKVGDIRGIWKRREYILRCGDAEYNLSGDLLRYKLRSYMGAVLDHLMQKRELGEMSTKSLLDTLRLVSKLDMDASVMGRLNGVNGGGGNVALKVGEGGAAQVIIVPMPESASRHAHKGGGSRLVSSGMVTEAIE